MALHRHAHRRRPGQPRGPAGDPPGQGRRPAHHPRPRGRRDHRRARAGARVVDGTTLVIRLRSPGIFTDEFGRPRPEPSAAELTRVLGVPARVERRWIRWQEAGGRHIASGLPKPAELAVAVGSTYQVHTERSVDPAHCNDSRDAGSACAGTRVSATSRARRCSARAGLKGLLRSRAEYILRSVGIVACADQRCGHLDPCWPCRVFGRGGGKDEDAAAVGARSLIRVPGALVRDWAGGRRTHIAIDRFTGGVLPGALYTMETLEAGWFDLRADPLDPVAEPLLSEIRAVPRLALEDLSDGIIGVGGGVARGYGTVRRLPALDEAGLPPLPEAQATLRRMTAADEH